MIIIFTSNTLWTSYATFPRVKARNVTVTTSPSSVMTLNIGRSAKIQSLRQSWWGNGSRGRHTRTSSTSTSPTRIYRRSRI